MEKIAPEIKSAKSFIILNEQSLNEILLNPDLVWRFVRLGNHLAIFNSYDFIHSQIVHQLSRELLATGQTWERTDEDYGFIMKPKDSNLIKLWGVQSTNWTPDRMDQSRQKTLQVLSAMAEDCHFYSLEGQ